MISPENASVVAIIIHFSGIEYTKQCIASLQTLSPTPDQIIVVNNGTTQQKDKAELEAAFPGVKLLLVPNRGYSAACNAGIEFSLQFEPDFVWILNNDLVFCCSDVLQVALETQAQQSRLAVTSVKMCYLDEPDVIHWAGGQLDLQKMWGKTIGDGELDNGQYDMVQCTEWVTGANMLIPVEIYRTVGGLDEQYFLYMEDVDWSLQLRQNGYDCLYVGTSKILHKKHASTSKVRDFYFPRAMLLFAAKHYPDQLGRIIRRFYNHQVHPHFRARHFRAFWQDLSIVINALNLMPRRVAWQGVKEFVGSALVK